MAVGRGLLVHRVDQVQHLDDAVRTQVEVLADQLLDLVVADLAGAEGGDRDRGRLSHADGVGDLHFATVGQAGGNHVLGNVAGSVGGRTVNLGRVLAGERATTVTGPAAVGVDDDLAAGQAAVAHRAADLELAGRVDVELGALVQPLGRQHRLDDLFADGLDEVLLLDARGMLGRQDHGVDGRDHAVFIAQGELALGIRTQPGQRRVALLADLGLLLDQAVRQVDRRRHVAVGFVGGIAEHQALVASAHFFRLLAVNALGDVRGLLADQVQHAAGGAVEADFGAVIADVHDDLAGQRFQVDPGAGGDLAGNDGNAGLDHGLAGHTGTLVLGQDRVQHRIGDLVGNLVRMAFRDRLGGEEVAGHQA
ncbi:hypothetical protein D3C73_893930 [compost metagenome]